MEKELEIKQMAEMVDEILRNENVEIEDEEKLKELAEAMYYAAGNEAELDAISIEKLSDAIVALDDTTYEIVSVDDARLNEKVKEQIKDEVEYIAQPTDADVAFYAETKDELKEELEDILDYEISFLEENSSDSKVYETLEELFGSETLAKASREKSDGTWMNVELKKISALNDYYIVVDDPEYFKAIQL